MLVDVNIYELRAKSTPKLATWCMRTVPRVGEFITVDYGEPSYTIKAITWRGPSDVLMLVSHG